MIECSIYACDFFCPQKNTWQHLNILKVNSFFEVQLIIKKKVPSIHIKPCRGIPLICFNSTHNKLLGSIARPASNWPLFIVVSNTRSPTTSAIAHTPCHQLPDECIFVVGQMRRLEINQFPVFVVVFAFPLFQLLVLA